MSSTPPTTDDLFEEAMQWLSEESNTDNGVGDAIAALADETPPEDDSEAVLDDTLTEMQAADSKRTLLITIMQGVGEPMNEAFLDKCFFFGERAVVRWAATCEICPSTNRTHYHMFVQFANKVSCRFCRKLLCEKLGADAGINIRVPPTLRGNAMNIHILRMWKYCQKEETRFPGCVPVVTGFPAPTVSSSDSTLTKAEQTRQTIIDVILKYPIETKWADIVLDNDWNTLHLSNKAWPKDFHALRAQATDTTFERRNIEEVILLTGAAGTGKTTYAKELANGDYWVQTNTMKHWFGDRAKSYGNEQTIIIDEYKAGHHLHFDFFKMMANKGHHGELVEAKNKTVTLNHSKLIITSNQAPEDWFPAEFQRGPPENWQAFKRRVTKWYHFPEKLPDGSLNRIEDTHSYHYVEKTLENTPTPLMFPEN